MFEEGGDTDAGVVGAEDLDERRLFEGQTLGQRDLEAVVDGLLGERLRTQGAAGEFAGEGECAVEEVVAFEHLVDETDAQRLVGADLTTREDEILGPRRSHEAGEALGATTAGDDAEQDLGLPETCGGGGEAQIAGQRQLAAPSERRARHRGDDHAGDGGDGGERCHEERPDAARLVGPAELGDVGPGGEDPLAARDDPR